MLKLLNISFFLSLLKYLTHIGIRGERFAAIYVSLCSLNNSKTICNNCYSSVFVQHSINQFPNLNEVNGFSNKEREYELSCKTQSLYIPKCLINFFFSAIVTLFSKIHFYKYWPCSTSLFNISNFFDV